MVKKLEIHDKTSLRVVPAGRVTSVGASGTDGVEVGKLVATVSVEVAAASLTTEVGALTTVVGLVGFVGLPGLPVKVFDGNGFKVVLFEKRVKPVPVGNELTLGAAVVDSETGEVVDTIKIAVVDSLLEMGVEVLEKTIASLVAEGDPVCGVSVAPE